MAKHHRIQKDDRNGNYFVRIQVAGTRKYFNLGPHLKEARRELARLEKRIARGELDFSGTDAAGSAGIPAGAAQPCAGPDVAGSSLTVRELAERHLDWLRVNRAPGTYALYDDFHKAFVGFVGEKKVSEITRLVMEDYYAWAKENRGRSANGGNVFLRHAKSLFLWAEEMDICPCPVKKFPKITETPPETKRFTDEEIAKLLSTAPPEFSDFRDMIVFGLQTGLRPQELRQLETSQIVRDGDGRYSVVIQQHKTARMAHEPKPRSVPLTPQAAEIALQQMAAHPNARLIFLNGHGKPYTRGVFRQRLRRWCKRAGIEQRPPYALRHTFGSIEAEANVNQTVIGQMMGHTQLRTTSRYIGNNAEHHRSAINAAGARIAKLAVVLLLVASTVSAACFTGRVERVIDGDTMVVGTNRVRLAGIDAPELSQSFGSEARRALSAAVLHRTVVVTWTRKGRYRRIIGHAYVGRLWVNLALVEQGWASHAREYSRCTALQNAEQTARRAARGMWASEGRSSRNS